MLLKPAKTLVKSYLHDVGIEIRKRVSEEFFDLTKSDAVHPVEAVYSSQGRPCLLKVPLNKLVTFNYSAFSLSPGSGHPFVKTIEEYEKNNKASSGYSSLEYYYRLYQPKNASALMDIGCPSYTGFDTLPALAALPLWSCRSPEAYSSHLKSVYQKEDEEQGDSSGEFIGGSEFGPVAPEKIKIEYRHLITLYESIKQHGYDSKKCEWITGTVWTDDENDWVVAISTGQHRLACLAALGYESATIYLHQAKAPGGLILRSCAAYFPSVVNGYHTEREALAIFDRILSKTPPKAANEWLAYSRHIT